MRAIILTVAVCAILCTAMAQAEQPIGDTWGVWEPQWKYVCFDKTTGEMANDWTPSGFCQRSNKQCVASASASCSGGASCQAMDGWCVCAKTTVAPEGYRCHAVARGELEAPVSGAAANGERITSKPESAYVYACFDTDSNEVVPHLKPDGFCSVKQDKIGHFHPVSYDCEDGASCVQVSNKIWSCKRDDVTTTPPGHVCMHMNAVELAAAVRGWPHPSRLEEFL
jgi:hypothetical protein